MEHIWSQVQKLKGITLYTGSRGKPFDITDVSSDRIVFVPREGNGTFRWASRKQIEQSCALSQTGQGVTRQQIQDLYPNDHNTSYIAAIVNTIVKV